MKKNYPMVQVEDFDIDMLKEAFLQGRLYVQTEVTHDKANHEKGRKAILRYVSRIDACASETYLPHIRQLWEDILHSPELGDSFFLYRYSSSQGNPNWYRVNAVMMALLELNVYRKDRYTGAQLHKQMEESANCTRHYAGMSRYLLNRKEISALKQLLKQ